MAERKILNETYRCDPMPASAAIELYSDMMRMLSQASGRLPSILASLGASEGEGDTASMVADVATLGALGDILQRNSSTDIRAMIERIVTSAQVKRPSGYAAINFDEEFTGNLGALLPVARFVIEVNFADFFLASGGSGLLKNLKAALARTK